MADIEQIRESFDVCRTKCTSICSNEPTTMKVFTSPSGEPCNAKIQKELGIFDIFKIGIGPSSSHTVGAMVGANMFLSELKMKNLVEDVCRVQCHLYGSFALTGMGHGTDKAVCVGLCGETPREVDPDKADQIFKDIKETKIIFIGGVKCITFIYERDVLFLTEEEHKLHPNAMKLVVFDENDIEMYSNVYLSLGGGFVQTANDYAADNGINEKRSDGSDSTKDTNSIYKRTTTPEFLDSPSEILQKKDSYDILLHTIPDVPDVPTIPYSFSSATELLLICSETGLSISDIMIQNEIFLSGRDENYVKSQILEIWNVMWNCIERGRNKSGLLPVSNNPRKAKDLYEQLKNSRKNTPFENHFDIMDWVCLYARSVNEENAGGGRIVTAPTNGASGTVPAVLSYYVHFCTNSNDEGIIKFLATAAAIGRLIKMNASISGAEAGCQAEVGSACAMAAAGLTGALNGTIEQIENAAEIGLEHNLGMTCDPIMGLVQVPCIERNCLAAVKAITAHRLALRGNGDHIVSFDSCVETMYRTGLDMQSKYRETSLGGLALYAKRPVSAEEREKSLSPKRYH